MRPRGSRNALRFTAGAVEIGGHSPPPFAGSSLPLAVKKTLSVRHWLPNVRSSVARVLVTSYSDSERKTALHGPER